MALPLALPLAPAEGAGALLADRLRRLGLPAGTPVEVHRNRRVLVTLSARGTLRVHEGYAWAPDGVLLALLEFFRPRRPRAARAAARALLVAFPVERYVPPSPRRLPRPRPEDAPLLARLRALHAELNQRHFGGALREVPLRLSRRMRRKLGEFSYQPREHRSLAITLNHRHATGDPWPDVRDTLLHEMIHQWQFESGARVDHGPGFRREARRVGVEARARRGDARSGDAR